MPLLLPKKQKIPKRLTERNFSWQTYPYTRIEEKEIWIAVKSF